VKNTELILYGFLFDFVFVKFKTIFRLIIEEKYIIWSIVALFFIGKIIKLFAFHLTRLIYINRIFFS